MKCWLYKYFWWSVSLIKKCNTKMKIFLFIFFTINWAGAFPSNHTHLHTSLKQKEKKKKKKKTVRSRILISFSFNINPNQEISHSLSRSSLALQNHVGCIRQIGGEKPRCIGSEPTEWIPPRTQRWILGHLFLLRTPGLRRHQPRFFRFHGLLLRPPEPRSSQVSFWFFSLSSFPYDKFRFGWKKEEIFLNEWMLMLYLF